MDYTTYRKYLTADSLRAACGAAAYRRGADYFHDGRVVRVAIGAGDNQTLVLSGACQGSASRPYQQTITLKPKRYAMTVSGDCSCPVEYNCKHVVAVCLAWKADDDILSQSQDDFDQWLEQFAPQGAVTTTGQSPEQALIYRLQAAPSQSQGLSVNLALARRKPGGGWSRGRMTNLSNLDGMWAPAVELQAIDEEILPLLKACADVQWSREIHLQRSAGHSALQLMINSGRAFWEDDRETPLSAGPSREVTMHWRHSDDQYYLHNDLASNTIVVPVNPPCYLDPETLSVGPLESTANVSAEQFVWLLQAPPVAANNAARVSRLLAAQHPQLPTPVEIQIETCRQQPTPCLSVRFNNQQPQLSNLLLSYRYGDFEIAANNTQSLVVRELRERIVHIHRDQDAEAAARQTLHSHGLDAAPGDASNWRLRNDDLSPQQARDGWLQLIDQVLPELEQHGWVIIADAAENISLGRATAVQGHASNQGSDWFDLRFDLQVDGQMVPLLPLISQLLADYQPGQLPETLYAALDDRQYVAIPSTMIEPLLVTILDLFDQGDSQQLRMSRLDAPRLLDLGDIPVTNATSLIRMAEKLRDFDQLQRVKLPTTFKGELRDYQHHGLDWLQFLRKYELGGILADDMGLGKTIQTLANLAVEKRSGRLQQPCLLIAPTSLMSNWYREAARFTPRLQVAVLHGHDRHRYFKALDQYDLVLTTYPLLPRDREALLDQSWHYVILDEAQHVKNPKTHAAQVVRALTANHRLCLTGTPMENHLGELWSQFDFLMPGFLGNQESFTRNYRNPIEKEGDRARLQRLIQRTAPLMLRRTKEQVASELPPKTELLRTTPISGRQASLYESIRLTLEKKVRDSIARKGLARSHITVLDALLKLRQVCCDPRLLPAGTRAAKGAGSAKLELLLNILPEMIEEGRRVLLFSQFTSMLSLIERELEPLNIPYTKLTGQTKKRDQAINRFRSGEVPLFLISLKAGGVGLNLTEADTVIHYDPWWNPAVEAQASDRAHRIGQDKPVFIYRLVTEGTVEEKILELQERKQKLADTVYGGNEAHDGFKLDSEAINALLSRD
ncbi:MAG: DEAD/DEAH box helicase [Wenzhouxiangellaceae bacterium]